MTEYTGEERRQRVEEHWHVKKEFNYGHIAISLSMFVSIVLAYSDLKEHDAVQDAMFKSHVESQYKQEEQQTAGLNKVLSEIKMLREDGFNLMQEHMGMHVKQLERNK